MSPTGSTESWPKLRRLSCEYNLTEHCNLSCSECDHASPVLPTRFASPDAFARDASALARVFHAEQLRIVGGEPLLHPLLVDFLRRARQTGLADQVILVTNGVLLHEAPDEMWDCIDQLWVSVYPKVKRAMDLAACEEVCRARGITLLSRVDPVFQKTLLNQRIDDSDLVTQVFRRCRLANETSCHTVHEGRFFRCSVAPFMRQRLSRLGVDFENEEDGVPLADNPDLYQDVEHCLGRCTPLRACAYCLGTSGPDVPIRQLGRKGIGSWLTEDHRALIEETRRKLSSEAAIVLPAAPESRTDHMGRIEGGSDEEVSRQLAMARTENARLEAALVAARAEVRALRSSMSWRLADPLRRGHDLLAGWLPARLAGLCRRLAQPFMK